MVWNAFTGKLKKTDLFSFPDLEKKLAEVRQAADTESSNLSRKASRLIQRSESSTKLEKIAKRNKPRTILVFSRAQNAKIIELLLQKNSNALASFVDNRSDAIAMLSEHHYDMVYIVSRMTNADGICEAPCFFSMDLEIDAEHQNKFGHFVKSDYDALKPLNPFAEFIAICDGDNCI